MTRPPWLALTLVVACLSGCAGPRGQLVLDRVGPQNPRGSITRGTGQLQVYTETQRHNSGGIQYQIHTPYWVYSSEGERVKSVENHVGYTDQSPMVVSLPAGDYRVIARAERYGLVTIPTVIEANRITQIYLEGAGMPEGKGAEPSKLVFLPGGPPVGWKAPPTEATKP